MLSPLLRTWGPKGGVVNLNIPHVMYHASGITKADIKPGGPMLIDNDRSYGAKQAYFIAPVGTVEKLEINLEFAGLLDELCSLRSDYCMDLDAINARLAKRLRAAAGKVSAQ